VLLFDFHGMGKSAGSPFVTYGIQEHKDVLCAVQFVRSKLPRKKIVLLGTSMGAASCILAAAREPAVAAVIAENPFAGVLPFLTQLTETVILAKFSFGNRALKKLLGPIAQLLRFLVLSHFKSKFGAGCRASIENGEFDAVESVKLLPPRPLLLMHGSEDQLVSAHDSERIHFRAEMAARRCGRVLLVCC
jgi:pimeloyl-ACP methyl ester carboxylesterase